MRTRVRLAHHLSGGALGPAVEDRVNRTQHRERDVRPAR